MLYGFLPYKNRNQSKLYINMYPLPLEPPSPILSHPFKQSHRATWLLYSRFPLSVLHIPLSQFFLPSPSSTVCTSPFSMSVYPFLPYKQVHQYCFSRFHINALICNDCFSLSDLLHSVGQALGSYTSFQWTQIHSFFWLSNILLYICTMSSIPIHLFMDIQVASMSLLL